MTAYLFVDTFAFEKLVIQPECRAGTRDAPMTGYETYLIEQWACDRKVNTVVASYTGNSHHVIEVQVLYVPKNLSQWSPTTFGHFEELMKMHILPKKTNLGNMLVTSLSSLPTNLTLVSMPQKYRAGYSNFVINENLRRLNVVGRIAVTADDPSESCVASFRRHFATSPVVSGEYAIQELVTLMQIALFYFGLLAPANVDGLLCDYTLQAIETWWATAGRTRYRTVIHPRPQEKMYMRTSCAALVGIVIGSRQRMSALGLKPPKDPFDPEEFVICIKRFQKMFKLPKTAIFDNVTYSKLLGATEKSSAIGTNSANVLSMMKSTVKEGISGKAAGAVDDWETLDVDVLARNVRGERCKYLWQGKGMPSVNHLRASLSTQNVGENTKIPLFSLPNVSSELDLQHPQDQHLHLHQKSAAGATHGSTTATAASAMSTPHHNSLHHHNYLPHAHSHHRNQSTSSIGTIYHSPNEHLGVPTTRAKQTESRSLENLISDTDWDEKLRSAPHEPEHKHFAHRFRIHRGSKPVTKDTAALAEPFDENSAADTAQSHLRRHSGSSDLWFVQHHNDSHPGLPLNNTSTLPTSNLENTTVVEEEEESPARKVSWTKTPETMAERRTEYWDIKVSDLLTKDDSVLYLDPLRNPYLQYEESLPPYQNQLRRTASLGEIEGIVFPYDRLAPIPEIVSLYEEARALQLCLKRQIQDEVSIKHELGSRISSNESTLADMLRDNMVIKYHVSATSKKEDTVRRRLGELEAFMARLDYELATLSSKLNDIDQSVMAFASKVDSADSKWKQLNKEQPTSWWSRWLGW